MAAKTGLGLYGGPMVARAAATSGRVPSRRVLVTEDKNRVLITARKSRVMTTT